jgi:hypothetical protein
MLESQPIRLGISGSFNEQAVDWMVRHMPMPARAYGAGDLNSVDFDAHDVLIDVDGGLSGRAQYLAQRLGYGFQNPHLSDKIRLEYTDDYPVPAKRGQSSELAYASKHNWIGFRPLPSNYPPVRRTLIKRTSLLAKEPLAVMVELGSGMAILCDVISPPDDRADLISHLAARCIRRGSLQVAGWVEQARSALPVAAASLFEVYDEIPFGLLIERAGLDGGRIDGAALMDILETLIREQRIPGRIRRDGLVKQ